MEIRPYYKLENGMECIDVAEQFSFNLGNVLKYIWRSGKKNPATRIEDLEKAQHYLSREINRLKKDPPV